MAQGGRIDYTIGFNVDNSGLQNIQKELAKINQMSAKEVQAFNPSLNMNEAMSALKKAQVAAYDLQKAMNEAFNPTLGITNINKLQSSLQRLNLTEIQKRFAAIGPTGQQAFLNISKSALTTNVKLKETSKFIDKIGETLVNTVKWTFSSSIVNRFTGAIQQAVGYVQHLDSSLNDIRIVTGKSADEMERFAVQANKTAQSLGRTTTDATEAALIYYQQGLSDEETQARMKTTLKAANVTGQSTAAVSEELTAVWNGYKVSTEETEAAVDKLAAVAATTASDLQELSTGMSKVASAANAMGVDMDQLNAQIATIISVTRQAPESVGTALKTIYARLADLKLGDTDEDGLGLGDVSGTLEKVGVAVLDANGDLRDMGDVIEDVAAKWNTWTSAQQTAIAEVMAGKRQYNNLVALFENWDMYSSALDTSRNSLGTLQNQQDIYMESTEAHINQLKAEWEDLYDSIIDESAIKTVTDSLRGVLNLITNIIDGLGGGKTLLTGLLAVIGNKFGKQISQVLTPFIQNIKAAKQNAAQLQTLLDNIETSRKNGDFGFEAAKAMRENQEEMSKYWHLMSAEEFNATQENIREIGTWTQKKEEIKQAEQQLKDYIETFGNKTLNKTIENKSFLNGNDEGKEVVGDATRDELIKRIENNQKKFENSVQRMKKAKEIYDKAFETTPSTPTGEENRFNKLNKSIDILTSNLKIYEGELRKIKKSSPELINEEEVQKAEKAINTIKNKIKQFNKEGKVAPDFSKEFAQEFEVLEQVIGKTESKYKVFLQVLKESGNYEEAIQALKKYEEALNKDIYSLQHKVEAISKVLGSIAQFAFGLQSLNNIGNIFNDDDLSAGEKLIQVITTLSMGLPAVIGGIKGFAKGLTTLIPLFVDTTAWVVKENIAETGSVATKKILIPLIGEEAAATTGLAVAASTALIALTALAAAFVIGKAVMAGAQKRLENIAEADRDAADAAAEHAKALQEEKDHLDEIINKYDELNQKIKEGTATTANAKEEIYDLCKQYGLQRLAVQALTSDYEDLKTVLEEAQKAANDTLLKGIEDQKEKEKQAIKSDIWQSMKGSQRDMRGGRQTIDLYGLGGSNSGERRGFEKALEGLGLEVDSSGHIDLDKFVEVAATNEAELYEILNSYNIKASNQLRTILKEQKENIAEYRSLIDEESEIRRNQRAGSIVEPEKIDSVQSYQNVQSELINDESIRKTFEDSNGVVDEEALRNWVDAYLAGIDEIKQYAQQADIASALYDDSKFSKEEIDEQVEKRSQVEIDFLVNNKSLAESYKDLDTFFDNYKAEIEQLQNDYSLITISTVIQNHSGDSFNDEEIQALYSDSNMANQLGVDQEEFTKASYDKQLSYIADYYNKVNQLETESQKIKREGLIAENEVLIQQTQANLYAEENKYASIRSQLDGFEEGVESVKNKWSELRKTYGGFLNDLDDYDTVIDKVAESNGSNEDILNSLTEVERRYITLIAEELGITEEDVVQKIKLTKELKNSSKAISNYSNKIASLEKQNEELVNGPQKDWTNMLKNTKNMLSLTNGGIDELQSAYSSLTSIMESYNEEGTLSMDNLQTFLNMDTQYLSALQIENGQMTLNEEALKQIALARLDEAEAEAYQQAIGELHDQQVRDGIAASGEASTANTALGNAALQAGEAARQGAAGWREYWNAALNREGVANDKVSQQIGQALYNKLQAIDSVRQRIMSGDLGGALGGSKSSGSSGGGSEKEAEHEEYLEREADIYHTINEELDQIESTLSRIQTINDHEWGIDAQKTLEEEDKLLDQQLDKLKEKKKLQEQDLSSRRKQLEDVGVSFSDDGSAMLNAEGTLDSLYAHYNQMVDMYNAMSAVEQETYKTNLEAEKDRIDKIEKKIDDYESTYSDYQSTLDSILDAHYAEIENEVKQFNNMIDVHLELNEARDEWNDFWYDVVQDVEDTDFVGQINKSIDALETLIGVSSSHIDSTVSVLTNHLLDTISEVQMQIASADNGGNLSIFGDDSALSKETLENYRDQLMEALTAAKQELDEISDNYLNMLDDAQDKIDKQVEAWEAIGAHLEHNAELIKLISGDKSYESLNTIYNQQYQNNLNLLTTQKTSMDYWKDMIDKYAKLLETTEEGSKEWKTYSEAYEKASNNYKEAVADLDKTVEDALNQLNEWKDSQLDAINDAFDRNLSGNLGLDQLEKEWNLINDSADRYLDNVERALGMEDLNKEFDDLLNNTNLTAQAQAELNKMRDEEIARLNEKNKLSQFDIDEVKARLEITKQQLALEDAQKNKSNLRLRRDSQGNYNYQYTGNEGDIEDASEGLMSAKREWYELVKNRNLDLAKAVIENRKNLQSELAALDDMYFENDDARRAKQLEIINKYAEKEKDIMSDAENAKQIFFDGTAKFFADVENNSVLPQWQTTVESLIDAWSNGGESSFTGAVEKGINDIEVTQDEFNSRTAEIMETAGVNYIDLKEKGIDPTKDSLDDLTDSNEDLSDALDDVNDKLKEQEKNLRNCEDAYNDLKDAAVNAVKEAEQMLNQLAQTVIQTQQQIQAAINSAQSAVPIIGNSSYTGNTDPSSSSGKDKSNAKSTAGKKNEYRVTYTDSAGGHSQSDTYTDKSSAKSAAASKLAHGSLHVTLLDVTTKKMVHGDWKRQIDGQDDKEKAAKAIFESFRSGGYTGAWRGSNEANEMKSGKLALLHQKELVLNEDDTKNMLEAVNVLRSVSVDGIADSIINAARSSASILNGVGSGLMQTISNLVQNSSANTNNYRNMTVNADFSGVRSADAIYQALMELENYGMQEAYSNSPISRKAY